LCGLSSTVSFAKTEYSQQRGHMELDEVIAGIMKLDDEREAIYPDDRLDVDERLPAPSK